MIYLFQKIRTDGSQISEGNVEVEDYVILGDLNVLFFV